MFRLRMIGKVIKSAGLMHVTGIFLVIFIICSLLVQAFEPGISHVGDALWYCFQAVTTIGFGDVVSTSLAGRLVTVVLSVISIFYLATLTGAVVNYCAEMMRYRRDESVARFLDELEHLPELGKDDLVRLSEKIKKFKHEKHQRV